MRLDTEVHIHEGLHVAFMSTKMGFDDFETCCLAEAVLSIEPKKRPEIQQTHSGHIQYFLKYVVRIAKMHRLQCQCHQDPVV
jgi:hypothetical protein